MKYLVAVSGGVDSVALLDMLARSAEHDVVVAHFDHGIRAESAEDALFVEALARMYDVPFVLGRGELGAHASEDHARSARYAFLRAAATEYSAKIATAHQQDDIIETIAINLTRGTGWRGLAVLNDPTIERPLLGKRKSELYDYCLNYGLEWVEDATNVTDAYLRNRIRKKLHNLTDQQRQRLLELFEAQRLIRKDIRREAERTATYNRYFLTMIPESVALELLRVSLMVHGASLTRPQRSRMLLAIKTARPGSTLQAGDGVIVGFTAQEFIVKHP